MIIATSGRVKSLITKPESKTIVKIGTPVKVRGHTWAGEDKVDKVYISTDFGIRWQETRLSQPANQYAWYHWATEVNFRHKGYYEIWARAFDNKGNAQPFSQPWNPKGYLGNVIHRVPVMISA